MKLHYKYDTHGKSLLTFLLVLNSIFYSFAQININDKHIQLALVQAGNNKGEIEKVIAHFKKDKDPLKLKAAYFLIGNMDIHYSADYYWADSLDRKVPFDEFAYPNLESSVAAFKELKNQKGFLNAIEVLPDDLKTIKAKFLIENIESAYKTWRNSLAKNIPFSSFCEYILPYRATVEPIQNWRSAYQKQYQWITDSLKNKDIRTVMSFAQVDYRSFFTFTWAKETRDEPLPRLGAQHLLFRKKGACEDVASLEVFIFRSQGIPVAYDYIPLWATSSGRHYLNTVFDANMKPIRLDVTLGGAGVDHTLPREPAKVIRTTYSKQPGILASIEKQENIPPGFMQDYNYIDVTDEYWETRDAKFNLFTNSQVPKTVYACMFSGGEWQPMWWGKSVATTVTFKKMPRGTAILPAFYIDGNLVPAGHPRINGFNNELELKPDFKAPRSVVIEEQERYLIFRPGKKYELFIWDKDWKLVGEKMATVESKSLTFENVPKNALMLLIPEYSQGRERPFIITNDNKRYWY